MLFFLLENLLPPDNNHIKPNKLSSDHKLSLCNIYSNIIIVRTLWSGLSRVSSVMFIITVWAWQPLLPLTMFQCSVYDHVPVSCQWPCPVYDHVPVFCLWLGHRQDTGQGHWQETGTESYSGALQHCDMIILGHWDMVICRTLDMVIDRTLGHGHRQDTGTWS
jgi:hypothetical protein